MMLEPQSAAFRLESIPMKFIKKAVVATAAAAALVAAVPAQAGWWETYCVMYCKFY
jgi:hypothetical protein